MSRILWIFFVELGIAALSWSQAPVVFNAGFEEGQDKPEGWSWRTGEEGQGEFEWTERLSHSGKKSFRVKFVGPVGYTALESRDIEVTPGKTYRLSAWIYPVRPVRRGVYFMISQYKPNETGEDLPNTFGATYAVFAPQTWQPITVTVSVRAGNNRLRIHCIQALASSEIYWDDFTIQEVTQEEKPRYEPPPLEAVPPLTPELRARLARRPRATAKIERRGDRPRLIVDGKPLPFAWHVCAFGGPAFFERAHVRDFQEAGVRIHLAPLVLGNGLYGARGPWRGPKQYDFSVVDEILWRVLRVDPDGYVIFYMCCDPYPDWGKENLDHVTEDQKGKKAIVWMHPLRWGGEPGPNERYGPSIVSLKLREDVAETLRRLVRHVESSEAGKAVIGYHVAGFNDGQWFQWASFDPSDLHLADYCPGAQEAFGKWLQARGKKPAPVPPADMLWNERVFVDPQTEQIVADYQRFYSEGVAENIMALARVLKQESKRPILCGTYYEDITCNSANHIALGRFLESEALDYLAGPAAYNIRMAGYQGAVRNVFGSTLRHGKMYLTEQDWRSWRSYPNTPEQNFAWGRAETAEIHNAMVRRECGMMLAFGLGTWWYDMGGGWFSDPHIMAGITEAVRAFTQELVDKDSPQADLAVIVSEESDSYVRMRYGGQYRYQGIVRQIEELNTAGVPYRLYLQSDLGRVPLSEHKAYLFLNPYLITSEQWRAIESLKRDGKLFAFVHAPGIIGAADPAQTASAITGIALAPLSSPPPSPSRAIHSHHPLLAGLEEETLMTPTAPAEALQVVDPQASPLALYAQSSAVGCAARDFGRWKSVFIGSPGISAAFAHNLARWAGCWIVAAPGDAVYASQHFLTIHALFPGHKILRLKQPAKVTDLTTRRVITARTATIELEMQRGETRWFRLD